MFILQIPIGDDPNNVMPRIVPPGGTPGSAPPPVTPRSPTADPWIPADRIIQQQQALLARARTRRDTPAGRSMTTLLGPDLTYNEDGSYSRPNDTGKYYYQADGSVFYSGGTITSPTGQVTARGPQTLRNLTNSGSTWDESPAGRVALPGTFAFNRLDLVPDGSGAFILPGEGNIGRYLLQSDGSVFYEGGTRGGRNAPAQTYVNGIWDTTRNTPLPDTVIPGTTRTVRVTPGGSFQIPGFTHASRITIVPPVGSGISETVITDKSRNTQIGPFATLTSTGGFSLGDASTAVSQFGTPYYGRYEIRVESNGGTTSYVVYAEPNIPTTTVTVTPGSGGVVPGLDRTTFHLIRAPGETTDNPRYVPIAGGDGITIGGFRMHGTGRISATTSATEGDYIFRTAGGLQVTVTVRRPATTPAAPVATPDRIFAVGTINQVTLPLPGGADIVVGRIPVNEGDTFTYQGPVRRVGRGSSTGTIHRNATHVISGLMEIGPNGQIILRSETVPGTYRITVNGTTTYVIEVRRP